MPYLRQAVSTKVDPVFFLVYLQQINKVSTPVVVITFQGLRSSFAEASDLCYKDVLQYNKLERLSLFQCSALTFASGKRTFISGAHQNVSLYG